MQTLVSDLLTLSRLEGSPPPGDGEWTPLARLLAQCEQEARGAVAAGAGQAGACASSLGAGPARGRWARRRTASAHVQPGEQRRALHARRAAPSRVAGARWPTGGCRVRGARHRPGHRAPSTCRA